MADTGRLDLDQRLTRRRTVEIDLLDLQRLSGLMRDCRFDLHRRMILDVFRLDRRALIAAER